jgi:maltose alpha-D-glucosyltransferase/alpha-amylase
MPSPWNAHAVVYAVDISYFQDSNGDGVGDIPGLIQQLDYLQDLGVDCLWLLPFYPSSHRDNGYDITEYKNVSAELGSLDDFRLLVAEAHRRSIRILIDLVVHHTSTGHPWFQAARTGKDSPYRDYYVWSPAVPEGEQPESIFPGVEPSVWEFDEVAGEFFFHLFYRTQPNLNVANKRVQDEIVEIAGFWMSFGVDGFRIDAANHLFEQKGIPGTEIDDPCPFLTRLHKTITRHNPDAVVLAEADVEPANVLRYTCEGKGIQLFLNFFANNYIALALARQQATVLAGALATLPEIPGACAWVNFLRNLDEMDLERLDDSEREEVYRQLGPEERMQVYGRGIRRRLAPMLGGDTRRLKMAFSMLLALPGSPMIAYGDEIGMGDDLSLPERESVRLPMQWSAGNNGGFSAATGFGQIAAPMERGTFGFREINVEAQDADEQSLLSFVRQAIGLRKQLPHFGEGTSAISALADGAVLACTYEHESGRLVTLHNLSPSQQHVTLERHTRQNARVLIANGSSAPGDDGTLDLDPYGYCWLQLSP